MTYIYIINTRVYLCILNVYTCNIYRYQYSYRQLIDIYCRIYIIYTNFIKKIVINNIESVNNINNTSYNYNTNFSKERYLSQFIFHNKSATYTLCIIY